MDSDGLRVLLDRPTRRFRTVHARVHEWIDHTAQNRGLPRFAANPEIASWIERDIDHAIRPPFDEVQELWLQPPDRYRLAMGVSRPGGPTSIEGMLGERTWHYRPEWGRVQLATTHGASVYLSSPGAEPITLPPDYTVCLHPAYAEPFDPPPDLSRLEVLGEGRYEGRDAIRAIGAFDDWDTRGTTWHEDFPPADDYALVVDAATGVLLKIDARFDGGPFSTTELLSVAFDENIPDEMWLPPPGVPQREERGPNSFQRALAAMTGHSERAIHRRARRRARRAREAPHPPAGG